MSDSEEKKIRGSDEEHHDKNDMSDYEGSKGSVSSSSSDGSSSSLSDKSSSSSSSDKSSSSSSVASKASKNASSAGEREEIDKSESDIEYPQSQNLLETSDDDDPDEEEESKPQLKEENNDQNSSSQNLLASSDHDGSDGEDDRRPKFGETGDENLDGDEPHEEEESKPQLKEYNDDQDSYFQNLLASSDHDGSYGKDDRKPKFTEAGEDNYEDEPKTKSRVTRRLRSMYEMEESNDLEDSASLPPGVVRPADVADWDRLADTKWGREVLYRYMTEGESSVLVGLATTYANEEAKTEFPMNGEFPVHDDGNPSFQDPEEINPLIGLPNDPMPPSYLHHIVRRALEAEEFDESLNHAFGDSAMVAIGMLVEEMVTASLLPLAGLHVLRCRELEEASSDEPITVNRQNSLHPVSGKVVQTLQPSNFRKEDNAFHEWTLPPEEALHKLYMDGRFQPNDFPTVLRPTRTIQPRFQMDKGLRRLPSTSLELESLVATNNFVYTHRLSQDLVKDNMDFFGLLLSLDPSPLDIRRWGKKANKPVRMWSFPGSGSKTDTVAGKKRKSGSTGARSAKTGRAKTGQGSKNQKRRAAQILPKPSSETESSDDVPLASLIATNSKI
jgi:hypothetical protein